MKSRVMKKLETLNPHRALLARQMQTYLNHLEGATERDELERYSTLLEAEENVLWARLNGLTRIA